jgi:acyl dehydratase
VRTFTSLEELSAAVGDDLGTSGWILIDQARIDAFAEVTGDHQWVHVDVERSAKGPFGRTIAHGYLTLSLVSAMGEELYAFETPGPTLNYGINKVRYPAPVLEGSRLRVHVTVAGCVEVPSGRQVTLRHVVEMEGSAKPACVAETVLLATAGATSKASA